MIITFWGTRGSVPAPGPQTIKYGGNTSCVAVEEDGTLIILDLGTGIRELGNSLLQRFPEGKIKGHILITHTHWDHIQGFPFFTPAFIPGNKFTIYGRKGIVAALETALAGQMMSAFFPVELKDMGSRIDFKVVARETFWIGELAIATVPLNHPGRSVGYKISSQDKSVIYLTDHEPYRTYVHLNKKDKPDACNGDDDVITDFCRGAALLICDAQYTEEEYLGRQGWGHMNVKQALELGIAAGVKKLVFTHHDPVHTDDEITNLVYECRDEIKKRGYSLTCFAASEGMRLEI